jgi:hypothetical protein
MTYVWDAIIGLQFQCTAEVWGSWCYDTSEGGNALAEVLAAGYGTWEAQSRHPYKENDQRFDLPSRAVVLDGGKSPREECEEAGGTWFEEDQLCEANPYEPGSPIIIATGDSSYKLSSVEDGVLFDINGDGVREQIAWTARNAEIAFLALDRDGDGYITSGKELFGNFTIPGESNGFDALARMTLESNGGIKRGSVSSDDPLFARLLLWTDRNHNGISESSELRSADELLSDIGLGYQTHNRRDGHGNLYKFRGWVHLRTAPGRNKTETPHEDVARRRQIFDVFLARVQR